MDAVIWDEHPRLNRPVMVAAFEGWNDAADAASGAVTWLRRRLQATHIAHIDPEEFYDFQATRPEVSLIEGTTRKASRPPSPKATQALLERLGEVLGMPIGLGDLAEAAVAWEARVNELVGSDADIAAYVRQLEERDDDQIDEQSLPSGDTLAAELERFLRDQRRD